VRAGLRGPFATGVILMMVPYLDLIAERFTRVPHWEQRA
jgi:hypothetical protein